VLKKIYCVHQNVVLFIILKYKLLSHLKSLKKSVHSHTVTNILPFFITIFIFSLLRSSGHFHPELHANFRFFFKKNIVVRYDLLDNFHSEHPAFCHSEHHVCFLYVGKPKRTSSRANRNEKLVRNVSFPKNLINEW
jgi:hypothetical protein